MKPTYFTLLQAIRGIGAILIFYHHFGFQGSVITSFGDFAVSLFFMISGLVLTSSYTDNSSLSYFFRIKTFVISRLIKIYPIYFISLIIALFLKGYYLKALPFDFLLLQSWIPYSQIYFSGNSVSWFVSTLLFCYCLFCPLLWLLNKNRKLFYGLFVGYLALYFVIVAITPEYLQTGIIYISPLMQLPTFILGMITWDLFKNLPLPRLSNRLMMILQTGAILAVIVEMFIYRFVDQRFALASYWWPIDILLLLVMLNAEGRHTIINRVFNSKLFQLTGKISFVFYLFHTLIITTYKLLLSKVEVNIPPIPSSILCLVLTWIISYLIHNWIEIPIARKTKKSFAKLRGKS